MLTPYDEFPVHQYSRPFSELPSTDISWDDGYYFGVYSAEAKLFLFTGMRINPNADIVGGYAGINLNGIQHTVRLSRIWRPDFNTAIGPLSYEFTRPMEEIRLVLEPNDSELEFDLRWIALAPPHLEAHHSAQNRMRTTTDQTRYTQGGTVSGHIIFKGERFEVKPMEWFGSRDHSWGLYAGRDPLRTDPRWLPPAEVPAVRRSMRFWLPFQTPEYSGFYQFHEDAKGNQLKMNDIFGTPFEGAVHMGMDGPKLKFVSARHELFLKPGTRSFSHGTVHLLDENGGEWVHKLEAVAPPWSPATIGYNVDGGSWKDGGNIGSYHGPGVYQEFDEFDLTVQPHNHLNHMGKPMRRWGREHLTQVHSTGPDGKVSEGLAQLEFVLEGSYEPYGLEGDEWSPGGTEQRNVGK